MGNLQEQFEKMGARVRVREPEVGREHRFLSARPGSPVVRLDIARDGQGEFYDIQADSRRVSLEVIDLQPRMRHLLLMSRNLHEGTKEKFLCGHDERAWFVAAVPGRSVSSVATAFEALKPNVVRTEQARQRIRSRDLARRRTAAYVRQGEWFFVPAPELEVPTSWIRRNEPLRRGANKPHVADYCVSIGGEQVYVCSRRPNGITEAAYKQLVKSNPKARAWGWRTMRRNAGVYVQGRIRHPDHQTIWLGGWHLVCPNTETEAPAMAHVAFLD